MKKRKMLTAAVLTLCAVALVAGSVLATVAYLTSSASVSNTFTVGNVGITMDEAKVNTDGERIDANGNVIDFETDDQAASKVVRVTTNAYHLVPGITYIKDPTIHITSTDNDMILFVKSRNHIRSIEAGNNGVTSSKTMREQMHANGWVEYVRSGNGMEIVWIYGTRDVTTGEITPTLVSKTTAQEGPGGLIAGVAAGSFKLCDEFTVWNGVSDLTPYAAAQVNFFAYAIQADGINAEDTNGNGFKHELTQAAWTAVKDSITYETGIISPKNPYSDDGHVDAHAAVPGVAAPLPVGSTNP